MEALLKSFRVNALKHPSKRIGTDAVGQGQNLQPGLLA